MNEKNVEALAALLREWHGGAWLAASAHLPNSSSAEEDERCFVEWLASRGVLVPSALDDDGIDLAGIRVHPQEYDPWSQVRRVLEKIAKGER
jgi:hypothetical protein